MKKTITKIFVILLLVVFNICNIYAANLNATLNIVELEQGKSFKISVNSSSQLTDFEVAVNNSKLGTPTVVSKYTGSSESTNATKKIVKMFQLAAQAEKTAIASGANLATFEYTVPSNLLTGNYNITVTLKAVTESGEKLNESTTKTIKVVAPKSTNTNLSSITIDGKVLDGFNKNTTNYTLATVESKVTSITVGATVEDSKAKVSGTGTIKLKEGKNTITLKVMAENGDIKTYTLTITRKEKEIIKSSDCTLKNIKVNGEVIERFDKNNLEYTLANVYYDISNLTLEADSNNEKATVEGIGKKELKVGRNQFTITVTAEDNTKQMYIVNVVREAEKVVQPITNDNVETNNYTIYVVIVITSIGVVIVITKFIVDRRKNK